MQLQITIGGLQSAEEAKSLELTPYLNHGVKINITDGEDYKYICVNLDELRKALNKIAL